MNLLTITYKSTHYYLLDCKGGKFMVDCGWPDTYPQFAAEFKRKGASPQDVSYVLVTHFHPDHAGLVQEFKNLGAKFILMESQVDFMAPFADFFKARKVPYTEIIQKNNLILKFAESRAFLADIGVSGEILSTPGHSDDSITLILDEGYAFTGDLPPEFLLSEEDTLSRQSWDRIHQHKIQRIFPAHG
ncbi:MAG: MBL fold metallo-hydrolase [Chloroflexi bacterium]|nr:MBL fold metallo-hydrolase [Chloroflexota bacterium]